MNHATDPMKQPFSFFKSKRPVEPTGPTNELQTTLVKLFEGHDLSCVVEGDWVLPNAKLPALRALWYPRQTHGQLDIHALVSDGVLIEECFAGIGEAKTGVSDAIVNFTANSFHVLLAALWERNDPSQVTTEAWEVSGKRYTAYVGNFGARGAKGVTPHIPSNLFAAIEDAIKREPLDGDVHWFRIFFANVAGGSTFEALKDNEDWDAGLACLRAISWEKSDSYYSVRQFIVLRAA